MKKLAEAFIERVNSKGHVEVFIETASLSIKIQSDDEHLTLILSNGGISITGNAQKIESPDALISGSIDSLSSILEGREHLRAAVEKGEIKLLTTFRNALFLESLFILAKNYDEENSVNQKFQIIP